MSVRNHKRNIPTRVCGMNSKKAMCTSVVSCRTRCVSTPVGMKQGISGRSLSRCDGPTSAESRPPEHKAMARQNDKGVPFPFTSGQNGYEAVSKSDTSTSRLASGRHKSGLW